MSSQQLADLATALSSLQIPLHISVESFKHSNFPLVAACLHKLLQGVDALVGQGYGPAASTPAERCAYLQLAGKVAARHTGVNLDLKCLYLAQAQAVGELLKLAAPLAAAAAGVADEASVCHAAQTSVNTAASFGGAAFTAQQAAEAAKRIVDACSTDILHRQEIRDALQACPDVPAAQQQVQQALMQGTQQMSATQQCLVDLHSQQRSLEAKAQRLRAEAVRTDKSCAALRSVRPPHLDQLQGLQQRMAQQFRLYLQRQRNIEHLELAIHHLRQAAQQGARREQHASGLGGSMMPGDAWSFAEVKGPGHITKVAGFRKGSLDPLGPQVAKMEGNVTAGVLHGHASSRQRHVAATQGALNL
ncbi:hypothetical protein WJX73_009108 [Symbiochloris irregularis]|uniref:Uncharacterized protein n=1 Tax=Symbiochloris irregularis TaxID=706552 RepID=A0AAW1P225_9CHLO